MKRLALLLLLPLASGVLFAAQGFSIAGSVPANGIVGVPYSASLSVSPTASATWSIVGLPPGLTWSPATGTSTTISGTPIAAGSYTFTVQAVINGDFNS